MRDGRSPLEAMEDVTSTRGLLDGRLKISIERSTLWQVQMDGRSSEVARPILESLANARFSARGLLHSRLTASADGRLLESTGCSTGAQRAGQARTCHLCNAHLTFPSLGYAYPAPGLLAERLTVSLGCLMTRPPS